MRYFSRPQAKRGGREPLIPALRVNDHVPVNTGLVDSRGDPIWRAPNPVGFHHPRVCG